MRVLRLSIVSICYLLLSFTAQAASVKVDKSNPYEMIQEVAKITFKRFSDERSAIEADPNLLKVIVREELMPYVNYKYSAYKVIGSNLKNTSDAERKAFVPVFLDYLVTSYAQVFTLYNNQEIKFEESKTIGKKQKILAVRTVILEPGRPPINIAFKVRKNKKTKEWKAFDMVAEGVSLLDSKQAELSSLIRKNGLPHVTELLREKSARNITFKKLG